MILQRLDYQSIRHLSNYCPDAPMRIFYLSHGITYPEDSGGRIRIAQLLRGLSQKHEIFQLSVHPGKIDGKLRLRPFEKKISQNYTEYVLTNSFLHGTAFLAEKLGSKQEFVLNTIMPLLENKRIKQEIAKADAFMLGAPWMFNWLYKHAKGKKIMFLTSDLGYAFYQAILPKKQLLRVFKHENRTCQRSHRVYAVTENEAKQFRELYGLPQDRVVLVPNGADTKSFGTANEQEKEKIRRELGMTKPTAVYVGGNHIPAKTAVKMLLDIAQKLPEVQFLVIGAAGKGFADTENAKMLGHIPEELKKKYLAAADMALNPTTIGPGSNVKLFEYLAAGLPVISTRYGLRGSTFRPNKDVATADSPAAFAKTIQKLLASPELRARLIKNARIAVKKYDWKELAKIIGKDL